jgi:L-ascorbate metabolism protein UlaG (beta-lactamase superfamily)
MPLLPKSRLRRVLLAILVAVLVIVVVLIGSTGWLDALGAAPEGERLARIKRSPNYRDGAFRNPEPTRLGTTGSTWKTIRHWLGGHEQRVPPGPMPIVRLTKMSFAQPPASGLRATWLGHSTVLVEIDGARILFDPVWARRASPSSLVGPKRFHEPPLALDDLPPLDAIVASHDHYDHLDRGVVRALARSASQSRARFLVPLGVGAHLERWGVAPDRITELDWSESTTVGPLALTATPARHFSGRGLNDGNHTLWASWSVTGPRHRIFHSGDTGPFPGFVDIGTAHGPFDLTFVKIGAYGDTWPDIHLTPEQAVDAHTKLQGKALLPIHWGTFNLAFHAWDEPAERVVVAATAAGARLIMPRPGESVEPATAPPVKPWWRAARSTSRSTDSP